MRKKVFTRVFLLVVCALSLLSAFSQGRTITGTILDEKGVSLPGATVTVKNSRISTSTDVNGKFTLHVPPAANNLMVSS